MQVMLHSPKPLAYCRRDISPPSYTLRAATQQPRPPEAGRTMFVSKGKVSRKSKIKKTNKK